MGAPVVIASNGRGFPVNPVLEGAPVLTIAGNGIGAPIAISENGAPFIVDGYTPVDFNWKMFDLSAGGEGQWIGFSSGVATLPQPSFGAISQEPTSETTLLGLYDDTASGVYLAVFAGDYVDQMAGLNMSIGGYTMSAFEVELISGNTWLRYSGPGDMIVGGMYQVLFG